MKEPKRILFVDDEPRVLNAIRRSLRRQEGWEMTFAPDAHGALKYLETQLFDIVVSDITMPKLNGVDFLCQVRTQYPDMVRILMSATTEEELIMKSVPVAHRFMSKPWNVQSLLGNLNRAFELRDLMSHTAIRTVVGGTSTLPLMPEVYSKLCRTLADESKNIGDIVTVISSSPAVVARLLHIVNSAFFAPARCVRNASDAVRYLGTGVLKSLVLTSEIFTRFEGSKLPKGFSLGDVQNHALLTARIASKLATTDNENARSAGLLHSVGKLIFADKLPIVWGKAFSQASAENRSLADMEVELFDTNYAEVGGYLLGLWGLPQDLVEAVANHCDPMRSRGSGLNLVVAVHLASVLAGTHLQMPGFAFDQELLEELGDACRMDDWLKLTAEIAAPADDVS